MDFRDKLRAERLLQITLPEKVELCFACKGNGQYEQTYNAGCGMGLYRSTGPCDYCQHPTQSWINLGYRMKGARLSDGEVPLSVINQIEVMIDNVKAEVIELHEQD